MLDFKLYDQLKLYKKPIGQRIWAGSFLRFNYRKVDIEFENIERIPDHPVIYALNHTDNYNFWPFQYHLHKKLSRYTASWVKGKNYKYAAVSKFLQVMNNIPLPSRGYLIAGDFSRVMKRSPSESEYRILRGAIEDRTPIEEGIPDKVLKTPRNMFGRYFDPSKESYSQAMEQLFRALMKRFVEINRNAMESIGVDLLVFPQGGCSIRLSRGHIGISQMAMALGASIVPVGCNGSDLIYISSNPVITKPGKIIYRIGNPIHPADYADIHVKDFEPFSKEAEVNHRENFQHLVDRVMNSINTLVDPRHQFSTDKESDGKQGVERFI